MTRPSDHSETQYLNDCSRRIAKSAASHRTGRSREGEFATAEARYASGVRRLVASIVALALAVGSALVFVAPSEPALSQEIEPTPTMEAPAEAPVTAEAPVADAESVSSSADPFAADASPRVYVPVVNNGPAPVSANIPWSVVFVSRQIPDRGSIYYAPAKDQPGVGAHSRFRVAAPGKLLVREPNGAIRTLIDGSKPTAASLYLIDVNAPDVSYDGTKIVFAGLPQGNYDSGPANNPGAWRIYTINVDGTGLRQVTKSDMNLNLGSLGLPGSLGGYDDTDPAWLPDGRIVFSSTRYPSFGHYSGVRTTNLFVINADGSGLRRITSERNGADRPMVDPLTGKIVFARWWRNHRFAYNDMGTMPDPRGGYIRKDGLTTERDKQLTGEPQYADFLWRNAWHLASINPDGTEVQMWSGFFRDEEANHVYGGTFTPSGEFVANFFPMYNMTEAAGFGGLRLYRRGGQRYTRLMGVTDLTGEAYHCPNPNDCSYGIFKGEYFTEPEALPTGGLIVSWAKDIYQDYGLYVVNMDGKGRQLLYDNRGTTELRARLIRPRPLPPVIPDQITQVPSPLPPPAAGPYNQDGTFIFNALNVYGNGPVDMEIVNAPPVGSAAKIRFFIDHQRQSPGSFPHLDWPILLAELPISPAGAVQNPAAPANVPLFEQIRSPNNTVPLTPGAGGSGAAHVAGMNYGRPGENSRCIGCHAGHSMIPVPANDADAQWSNLAPGAAVVVSSSRDPNYNTGVIDRRVMKGEIWRYWTSAPGQQANQWVKLIFPVPVTVRAVRLYNPRQGDEANSSLQVQSTTVRLFSDAGGTNLVATQNTGPLAVTGTTVNFADVKARVVQVDITGMTGTFYGARAASIAEIEVIARGEQP